MNIYPYNWRMYKKIPKLNIFLNLLSTRQNIVISKSYTDQISKYCKDVNLNIDFLKRIIIISNK